MILSNEEIIKEIKRGNIKIGELTGDEPPDEAPFNTTAIDLKLSSKILIPKEKGALAVDVCESEKNKPNRTVKELLGPNCNEIKIYKDRPYRLDPMHFVLSTTKEKVYFPTDRKCFAGRIEGKSSNSRCGLIVHCTAPTIHASFNGHITLEIANLSTWPFLLYPDMYICQLIIEEVRGKVKKKDSQFNGQYSATGQSQDQDLVEQKLDQMTRSIESLYEILSKKIEKKADDE